MRPTGFSIGVSRLLAALRAIESSVVASAQKPGPVVVVVLDREYMADYQRLIRALRSAGIASELYLGDGKMNAQLKYADKRGSLCAVIQGSNERDAPGGPQVVIRDLALGAELAKASKDRSDYLQMRQRAQVAAPEDGVRRARPRGDRARRRAAIGRVNRLSFCSPSCLREKVALCRMRPIFNALQLMPTLTPTLSCKRARAPIPPARGPTGLQHAVRRPVRSFPRSPSSPAACRSGRRAFAAGFFIAAF